MNIDTAESGHIQDLLGQDPSVGHHGTDIRLQGSQLRHGFLAPEILRLENRQVMGDGNLLHRRKHHLHATALGPVRLCIYADHFKAVSDDLFQTGRRDIRRSHEYNSQTYPSRAINPRQPSALPQSGIAPSPQCK